MAFEPSPVAPATWPQATPAYRVPCAWTPAGVWRRVGAGALDLVLVVAAAFVLMGVAGAALGPPPPASADLSRTELVVVSLSMAALVLGPQLYAVLCWRSGATLGMRAAGLQVIDARTGDRPSTEQALLRLVGTLYGLLPLGAGLVAAALRADRRAWQDRISGTAVVHGRPVHPSWAWDGWQWVWTYPPDAAPPAGPVPTGRRAASPPRPPRSAWTWTDVVPLLVLFLPAAMLGQLVVVVALHVVRTGHGHPAAISLLLDVVAYGVDLGLVWVFLGLRRHVRLADLGLRLPRWPWLLAALPALVCAWTGEAALGAIGRALLPAGSGAAHNQCTAIQSDYHSAVLLGLVGVAVVAPVVEEILFRGVVFGWLRGRTPVVAAAVISAALFSLAHIGWGDPSLLLPVFAIGLVLAGLYQQSGSLWPGILVHASVNTVATLVILLAHSAC